MNEISDVDEIEVQGGAVFKPVGPILCETMVVLGEVNATVRFSDAKGREHILPRHCIVRFSGGTIVDPVAEARKVAKAVDEEQADAERRGGIVADLGGTSVLRFLPPVDAIERFGHEHVEMLITAATKALADHTGSLLPHALGYVSTFAASVSRTVRTVDETGEPGSNVATVTLDGSWGLLTQSDLERLRQYTTGIVSRVVVAYRTALDAHALEHPLPAPPPAPVADGASSATVGVFGAQVPAETVGA